MEHDYVIVGGGATLAARLSQDPAVSVCLVEAGGGGRGILVRAPAMGAAMISGRPKINNWALKTGAQLMDGLLAAPPLAPWRGKRLYPHDGTAANSLLADGPARPIE